MSRKQLVDGGYRMSLRCGSLNSADWKALLHANSILFMTPQTLLNMFDQGVAKYEEIDLLVSSWPRVGRQTGHSRAAAHCWLQVVVH